MTFPVSIPPSVGPFGTVTVSAAGHGTLLHIEDRNNIIALGNKLGLGTTSATPGTNLHLRGIGGTLSGWDQIRAGDHAAGAVSAGSVVAGSIIVRQHISGTAGIELSKLEAVTAGHILASDTGGTIVAIPSVINVKAYGATGDGVTDDTAAIRAAIAAIELTGGILFFSPGTYRVTETTESEIFLCTKSIIWQGCGFRSRIVPLSTIGASTDVIRYAPDSDQHAFFAIRDLMIWPQSSSAGRHVLNLDITTSGRQIQRLHIERCWFDPMGGKALVVTNPSAWNASVYDCTVADCLIYNGLQFNNAGDNILVHHNKFWGKNAAVEADLVSGAGHLQIIGNASLAAGGLAWVKAGNQPIVEWNNAEVTDAWDGGSPNKAIVDIAGASGARIAKAIVRSNHLGFVEDATEGDCVRIGYADEAVVDDNTLNTLASYVGIRISADAIGTHRARNRVIAGAGALVANAGDPAATVSVQAFEGFPGAAQSGLIWQQGGKFSELRQHVGSTIASASTIAPPSVGGNVFVVSGTTTINTITARGTGDRVTLIASGAWALGAAGNIKASAATMVVDRAVELQYDGTNWYETGRGRLTIGANKTMLTSNGSAESWSASPTVSGTLTAETAFGVGTGGQSIKGAGPITVAAGASHTIVANTSQGPYLILDAASGETCIVILTAGANTVLSVFASNMGGGTPWNINSDAGSTWAIFQTGGNYVLKNRTGAQRDFVYWMRLGGF